MKTIKEWAYPKGGKCPICRKGIRNHQVVLNFGVMEKTSKNSAMMLDNSKTKLHMSLCHHEGFGGRGHVEIADVNGSQVDWMFCSTKCFRKFFSNWADELDKAASK